MPGWQEALFEWHTPIEFEELVDTARVQLGEDWKKRRGRPFREAFVASAFAYHQKACQVRLLAPTDDTPTPDFELLSGERIDTYEITEADNPGRRRGIEPPLLKPTLLSDDDWTAAKAYHQVVAQRSENKARKPYASGSGLIIYDNGWVRDSEMLSQDWWSSATQLANSTFKEVWVFRDQDFLRLD